MKEPRNSRKVARHISERTETDDFKLGSISRPMVAWKLNIKTEFLGAKSGPGLAPDPP
jgi:flavodoxin